jgi:oligopeptide/dipeptide ABC transporter ATP-binding protein
MPGYSQKEEGSGGREWRENDVFGNRDTVLNFRDHPAGDQKSKLKTIPTEKTNSIILSARGVKKYFPVRRGFLQKVIGWVKAVDGVDLEIRLAQTLGLVGESGCGKTTMAQLILKLIEPDAGTICFRGQDITSFSPEEMKPLRKEIQIVFQDPYGSLNPRMSVGQSIEEGLRDRGGKVWRRERVRELLEMVGMPGNVGDRYPHEFSGGQRQRIGIARALSVEPSLIICDEPVSALDVSIQAQIINLLKSLQAKLGLSYLFIAHDLNVVEYISDTLGIMYLGQMMEYGPADLIYDHPLHPYSLGLMASVPVPEPGAKREWHPLKGDVPTPFNPPPGCKFQGRCPLVEDRCRGGEIEFYPVENGRRVRCWKVLGK